MTDGALLLVWTASAMLGLVAAAYVGAAVAPAFLFHQRPTRRRRTDRSYVQRGRVFCRVQGVDIDLDACVGCSHLRVVDGTGAFIVCDGRPAVSLSVEK